MRGNLLSLSTLLKEERLSQAGARDQMCVRLAAALYPECLVDCDAVMGLLVSKWKGKRGSDVACDARELRALYLQDAGTDPCVEAEDGSVDGPLDVLFLTPEKESCMRESSSSSSEKKSTYELRKGFLTEKVDSSSPGPTLECLVCEAPAECLCPKKVRAMSAEVKAQWPEGVPRMNGKVFCASKKNLGHLGMSNLP